MYKYNGKTALITGASTGIGAEFARKLAKRGMNVILVARSADKLQALAAELKNIKATVIPLDLTLPDAASIVRKKVSELELQVDLLVNNAGFGTFGPFEAMDPELERNEIQLNVVALVDLTHAFIQPMLERGEGAVINVASVAAHQPVPYLAVYAATKAFVLSFSEALWAEYKDRGIRVLSLNPGATKTEFHSVAKMPENFMMESVSTVVDTGLKALEEGKSVAICGLGNAVMAGFLQRLVPREQVALVAKKIMGSRLPKAKAHTEKENS
jgi:short-subunit dehydrogenase